MNEMSPLIVKEGYVPATQAAEGLPRRRWSVKKIREMVEKGVIADHERFELIGGEIVPMASRGIRHERLKLWLNYKLIEELPKVYQTIPESTLLMSDDTFVEPDFTLFKTETGLEGLKAETALLAIEISDSSKSYDRGRKAEIYAHFKVAEVWAIDVSDLSTRVFRDPSNGVYQSIRDAATGETLTPALIDDFSISLKDYE